MEQIDDSYGTIGDLYGEMFEHYLTLPRNQINMPPTDFLQDLIELLIWEDYGLTDDGQPAFFAGLTPVEVEIVEQILRIQWPELDELDLFYQSEEVLTMLGILCVQHGQFEKFVDLAKVWGPRHWERITTMAQWAEQQQQSDLALAIYEAALRPGSHEKFLRKKYEELKKRVRSPSSEFAVL